MKLPDFSSAGRVALTTGAGRGLGLGMANALAAAGAAVVIQDIAVDIAQAEADKIIAAGGRAAAIPGDATAPDYAAQVYQACCDKLGPPDILINNASIQHHVPFLQHSPESMQKHVDADILSAVKLCQLVIPHMQQQKWGRIINISSVQAKGGNAWMPIYAISKAGMENLTRGLARAFGHDGILVNCIGPGWMNTLRNQDGLADKERAMKHAQRMPVQRYGEPDDLAGVALLLCSPAGAYITGQTIYVDGGLSI